MLVAIYKKEIHIALKKEDTSLLSATWTKNTKFELEFFLRGGLKSEKQV